MQIPNTQPPQSPTPQPLYVLSQNKKRALLPKVVLSIFLGTIFYFALILNLSLLKLSSSLQNTIKTSTIIFLIFLIFLNFFLDFKKTKKEYFFYPNHIAHAKKQILLTEIIAPQQKQNLIDKIFKTYSLTLTKKFKIEYILQTTQLEDYLKKLIAYAKQKQI